MKNKVVKNMIEGDFEEEIKQPTEEVSKAVQNWCPNCKECRAVEIVERKGEDKVRVKCLECGHEWECFI